MRTIKGVFALQLTLLLIACGGGNTTNTLVLSNPPVTISALSPTSVTSGANGFTLNINGSGFSSLTTVSFNGTTKSPTIVSSSQMTINVDATDISAAGTAAVSASNPAPGGGTASSSFTINPPVAPVLSTVTPNSTPPGTAATLTVSGYSFVKSSLVQWNSSTLPTTYVNNKTLIIRP